MDKYKNQRGFQRVIGLVVVAAVALAFIESALGQSSSLTISRAIHYLATQGYTAYASPSGDFVVTGNLVAETGRNSTLVVAGVNATQTVKNQADYVADGTGDNVEIQAAINALSASRVNKEKVKLIGTFNIASAINTANNTILDLTEAKLISSGNNDIINITATYPGWIENVDIIGGVLDGTTQTDGQQYRTNLVVSNARYVNIIGLESKNSGYYGIDLFQTNYVTVRDVYSHDNYRHGLHPGSDVSTRGWYNSVIGGHYDNNGVAGVDDRGSSYYNTYIGVSATGNGAGVGGVGGFYFASGTFIISDVSAVLNSQNGFTFEGAVTATISNLVSHNNTANGINARGAVDLTINNPYISGNAADAGGIIVNDFSGLGAVNVDIRGGSIKDGYRNIWLSTTAGIGRINLDSIIITGGSNANYFRSGTITSLKLRNLSGYVTEGIGSSVGTGAQQTIAHGLNFTPTKQQIAVFADNSTGTAYQSANPDATNIYVTEIANSAWHWATVRD